MAKIFVRATTVLPFRQAQRAWSLSGLNVKHTSEKPHHFDTSAIRARHVWIETLLLTIALPALG